MDVARWSLGRSHELCAGDVADVPLRERTAERGHPDRQGQPLAVPWPVLARLAGGQPGLGLGAGDVGFAGSDPPLRRIAELAGAFRLRRVAGGE
jgi:hypothetical protein